MGCALFGSFVLKLQKGAQVFTIVFCIDSRQKWNIIETASYFISK